MQRGEKIALYGGTIVGKKFWQIFRNGMDNESEDSITIKTIPESIYSIMLLILTILQLVLATTLIAASESGNGNALKAIVVGP